jgi:trimethylamine--corrinoid protein Co-methyltransferase
MAVNASDPAPEHAPWQPSGLRLLGDAHLAEIHHASLEVLRRTGVRVYEEEAVALLASAGCLVSDKTLVRFPAAVVESALQVAPSRIVLCGRDGEARLYLQGHRSYFGTGSDLLFTRDLESGARRQALLADVAQMATLTDSLPNLDFVMSMALPSDVPIATSDRHAFRAMLRHTTKPLVYTAWDEHGLADILAMAQAVAGSRAALQLNPFLLAYLEPTSPLQHSTEVVRKLLRLADEGLPFVYAPGPVEGASAPVTSAGSLVMANAEVLSGLVIAQLRRPGTPFVYGSGSGPMDMRTTVATYASPEFMLHMMATAELAHHFYHLPVWGFAGCADAQEPGLQAGVESALWILWTALSGANLVHDVGYLESGLTGAYEMVVVGDEIIGLVRRLLRGIPFSPATLALDVIDAVGPGGDYLGTDHTLDHYRAVWYPRIFDRRTFAAWQEAGAPNALDNARALVRAALVSHTVPPLPADVDEALAAIVADADARLAGG